MPTQLLLRLADSHKGDYGHVFVIAGSPRFSGAAVLAAEAAMRSGSGSVTLGIPKGLNSSLIKIKPKEVMTLPLSQSRLGNLSLGSFKEIYDFAKNADVIVVGPGLGKELTTQKLVRKIVEIIKKPMVIDADGLNALVSDLSVLRRTKDKPEGSGLPSDRQSHEGRGTILTPHPAEMARLMGVSVSLIQKKRKEVAQKIAKDYNVTVVLKGNNTIVAEVQGNLYVNKTGNPGMATAGSGDVLSGMIASFLGQGLDGFSAAKYAVYLHGLAGDLAAQKKTQMGLIASDIIDNIPEAIERSC
ncbi:MAG: NAD(P)H-hydrate dehydratase [Candidatus Omnitrophica bacterium]|nr:NAD(P)H-hydrate dehydratase [Candidatus Omnitrophota bacterium]